MPKIHEGLTYRKRSGERSGEIRPNPNTSNTVYVWWEFSTHHTYTTDGRLQLDRESPHDLMRSWEPGSSEKLICDVSLDDYRRGVAKIFDSYKIR